MDLKRTRWGIVFILAGIFLAACGGSPDHAADTQDEAPASAPAGEIALVSDLRQGGPTPTPGFGPIITDAPPPTPPPGVTLTATPTPSPAPAGTATPTEEPTATPTIAGTPLPMLRSALMGIQINPDVSEQDYNLMLEFARRMGLGWVKFQFAWDLLEPEPGTLSQLFFSYRLYVQRASQQGFKVMVSIAKAPDWARASLDEDGPPRDPQALAGFISRMMGEVRVDLYGNSYFNAIEIWNEPNLRREWNGGTLSGAEYMRLFDAAYHAIRAGEGGPSVTIITAGLAPTGINDGVNAIDDRAFLRQMYAAGLANPAYQNVAIGVHPYGAANPPDARCCANPSQGYDDHPTWFFLDTLEDYHTIMQENGDTGRQLWATEFGWGTWEGFVTADGQPAPPPADPPYFQQVSLDEQANYTLRAFEIAQGLPYMGPMVLWNLNFAAETYIDERDPRAGYALLMPRRRSPLRPAFRLLEAAPKQ